jgi:hypothetical protein
LRGGLRDHLEERARRCASRATLRPDASCTDHRSCCWARRQRRPSEGLIALVGPHLYPPVLALVRGQVLALRRHQHRVTLSAPPTERVTRVTFISNAWCSTRPGTAGTEASVTAINDDDMTERKDLSRRRHRHHHQRSHCEAAQCPRSCCECTGRGWCPCERAPWSYGDSFLCGGRGGGAEVPALPLAGPRQGVSYGPGRVRGHSPHSAL